jgi:hypothetical protein
MNENERKINYTEEFNKLSHNAETLKLVPGEHKVVFLTEGYIKGYYDEVTKEAKQILFFLVNYNQKEYVWNVGKSKTESGLYGQILKLGVINNNRLIGVTATVIVKPGNLKDGKKVNDYTIKEIL